jgi:hypothetical protein
MSRSLVALAACFVLGAPCVYSDEFPAPGDVKATATLTVDVSSAEAVVAKVHVEFQGYYHISEPVPVQRDAAGRFILQAKAEPAAVIQIFPPPPFPVADLSYKLGAVPRGSHVAVFRINGKTFAEKTFTVGDVLPKVEARVTAKVEPATAGSVAHVRIELPDPYFEMTDPGHPARDGQSITINATMVRINTLVAIPAPKIIERDYSLGALSRGEYKLVYKIKGETKLEMPFLVGAPPDYELRVDHLEVGSDATGRRQAIVTVPAPPSGKSIDWGQVERAENRFAVHLKVVDGPPVDPAVGAAGNAAGEQLLKHLYDLGTLAEGTYRFVALDAGTRVLRETEFRVAAPPVPDRLIGVNAATREGKWFGIIDLMLMPDVGIMPLQVQRKETHFHVDVELTQLGLPLSEDDVPRPVRLEVELGVLAPGGYLFSASLEGVTRQKEFRVIDVPPPPGEVRLAFIEIRPGTVSTVASVGLVLPSGKTVTDWGEVKTDGSTFRAMVTVGDAPPNTPDPAVGEPTPILPVPIVKHLYSLGLVAPGQYTFELLEGARLLGSKPFRVEPKPPPPPPPRPVVAFIQPGHENADWFVDVGLAFSRPALEVKDWGTPARDGNKIKVNIQIGEATPPPDPAVPVAGGTPVFLGPPVAADGAVSPVPAGEADRFHEIGNWPAHLVRHRYPLGALEQGEYVFVVFLEGEEVAHKAFAVGLTPTPGPTITVRAETIAKKTDAPQTFTILYTSPVGFKSDPGAGPVVVRGPHDFSGKAVLTERVDSLDPIGRLISCTYEVEGPGDDWDAADNGEYSVCVDPAFVVDRNGHALDRPCVFGWRVRIEPAPPPHLDAKVAVSMKDGIWQADVSFENTGGWFAADWGEAHLHGTVFSAHAELRVPPFGSLVPIPLGFEHTYPLGELKPGRYLCVFKSNAGHFGSATFELPGVEPPTPLAQWKLNVLGENAGSDTADDDLDGLPVFAEFYLGLQPDKNDPPSITPALVHTPDGDPRLVLDFRRVSAGDGSVRCVVQVSKDMVAWQDAGDDIELVPGTPESDGTQLMRALQKLPIRQSHWPFMRLRLEQTAAP